jgi:hypothetical protein
MLEWVEHREQKRDWQESRVRKRMGTVWKMGYRRIRWEQGKKLGSYCGNHVPCLLSLSHNRHMIFIPLGSSLCLIQKN